MKTPLPPRTVPDVGSEPSPQLIVAEKLPCTAARLGVVKPATGAVNTFPSTGFVTVTGGLAGISGASAIVAVLATVVWEPPTSLIRIEVARMPSFTYVWGALMLNSAREGDRLTRATLAEVKLVDRPSPQVIFPEKSESGAFPLRS